MRTLEEARTTARQLESELAALRRSPSCAGTDERIKNVAAGLAAARDEIAALEERHARVRELAEDPRHTVGSFVAPPGQKRDTMKNRTPGFEAREAAQRALDDLWTRDAIAEDAGARLYKHIERDKFGLDSAYVAAASSPAYERAFAKRLTGFSGAESQLEPDESEAMLAVGRAMAQRAMAVGEGKTGGFAVPLSLDPTILLTNDGAINPIRDLATVSTITTTTWAGVASAGVKAEFLAEAAKGKDNSPELSQPEVTPAHCQIYMPYSFEAGMDWPGLSAELAKLFADAKAVKEAEIFATGKGSENIPQGLISGATKLVETATKEVVVSGDVYALQEALAPRWQPKATWLGSNKVSNQIYRYVAAGDTEEPRLMNESRDAILGKPFKEVSTMSTKTTTKKERVLAFGDIGSAYRIVDRLGLTVETIPVVMDEGVPTGQRALLAWFRVGAGVVNPSAVQVLAVKE